MYQLFERPFPGTFAVGIDPKDPSPRKGGSTDPMAPVSTLRPWKNGSNMDINELQAGSTIFFPVFLKGGDVVEEGEQSAGHGDPSVRGVGAAAYRRTSSRITQRHLAIWRSRTKPRSS